MQENVAAIIKKLGGPDAVASSLEVGGEHPTPAAVTMWGQRNMVPWKWRSEFLARVEANGGVVTPGDAAVGRARARVESQAEVQSAPERSNLQEAPALTVVRDTGGDPR